jgi:prevent-host-death family protein
LAEKLPEEANLTAYYGTNCHNHAMMTMVMKIIPAGQFKAQCLALMDQVEKTREPIIITKRGKQVAKLVPAEPEKDDLFGSWKGKIEINGDIVAPVFDEDEWDCLK